MNKINFVRLSTTPDKNNNIDFICNTTKNNYIKLNGYNEKDAIQSLHSFLCNYEVWSLTDKVVRTLKPINFIPDCKYHNISFILKFYNMALLGAEARKQQITSIPEIKPPPPSPINLSPPNTKIIVKNLTNPNINHDENLLDNESLDSIIELLESDETKQEEQEIITSSESFNTEYSNEKNSLNDSIDNSINEIKIKPKTLKTKKIKKSESKTKKTGSKTKQIKSGSKTKKIKSGSKTKKIKNGSKKLIKINK